MRLSTLARSLHRTVVGSATLAALAARRRGGPPRVFYGGARSGALGGPLVKVSLLRQSFPEQRIGFSLVYILSSAIYLPRQAIDLLRRRDVPIVLNQNGVFYPAWYPQGWERENARMAHVHEAASHVLYQSEFCRRVATQFLGPRSGPSEVLYNGVDTQAFAPGPAATRSRPFTFLVTGKIGSGTAYRLSSSIAGLAQARRGGLNVRLTVAGRVTPMVLADARRLAEREGVSQDVIFAGSYGRDAAPDIYRSADAYLITKHNDPCPNVVLEAMACGLPVLFSSSGGIPELVGTEAGVGMSVPETFEATPTPPAAVIAEGMAQVMRAREAMSAAARARCVARFDLGAWIDRHRRLFQSLTGSAAQ
jgi:glycosyltransferase involved in cell wall biosynthesis